jgi:hypothetical protein
MFGRSCGNPRAPVEERLIALEQRAEISRRLRSRSLDRLVGSRAKASYPPAFQSVLDRRVVDGATVQLHLRRPTAKRRIIDAWTFSPFTPDLTDDA